MVPVNAIKDLLSPSNQDLNQKSFTYLIIHPISYSEIRIYKIMNLALNCFLISSNEGRSDVRAAL